MQIFQKWSLVALLLCSLFFSFPTLACELHENPITQKELTEFLTKWYQLWDQNPKNIKKLSRMVAPTGINIQIKNSFHSRKEFRKALKKTSSTSSQSSHALQKVNLLSEDSAKVQILYTSRESNNSKKSYFDIKLGLQRINGKLQIVSYIPKKTK